MAKVHLQEKFQHIAVKPKKTLCGRDVEKVRSTRDVFLVTCEMCRGLYKYLWTLSRR